MSSTLFGSLLGIHEATIILAFRMNMAPVLMRGLYVHGPGVRMIMVLMSPCTWFRATMNVTTTRHFKEAGTDGTFRMIF